MWTVLIRLRRDAVIDRAYNDEFGGTFSRRTEDYMTRWLWLCVVTIALAGCSDSSKDKKSDQKTIAKEDSSGEQQSPRKDPSEPKSQKNTAKTTQDARAELQARIDRYLGGQPANKLFPGWGIWAVGKKITSMDIVRVVQKYDKDGTAVPNGFVAVIRCVGEDTLTGRRETKEFETTDFLFHKGEWILLF